MGRRTRGRPAAARIDGQGVRAHGAIRLARQPARSAATFRLQAGLRPVPEAESASVRRRPPDAVATTPSAELRRRGLAERPSCVRCDTLERFRFLGGSATVGERYASRPASRRHERTARPERASRIVPARSAGNSRMPLSDRHAPTSQVSGLHRIDAPVERAGSATAARGGYSRTVCRSHPCADVRQAGKVSRTGHGRSTCCQGIGIGSTENGSELAMH